MSGRMTDDERAAACTTAVTEALDQLRDGQTAAANATLAHAAHAGIPPGELAVEIIAQTGGAL